MGYEDYLGRQKEDRDRKIEFYTTAGQAGTPMDQDRMREDDPVAWYAYRAGQQGQSVEDAKAEADRYADYRQALIAGADVTSGYFGQYIVGLAESLEGRELPALRAFVEGEVAEEAAGGKVLPWQGTAYRDEDDNIRFDVVPSIGERITLGGRTVEVISSIATMPGVKTGEADFERFVVRDPVTDENFEVTSRFPDRLQPVG